jgi:hypothetical protein
MSLDQLDLRELPRNLIALLLPFLFSCYALLYYHRHLHVLLKRTSSGKGALGSGS